MSLFILINAAEYNTFSPLSYKQTKIFKNVQSFQIITSLSVMIDDINQTHYSYSKFKSLVVQTLTDTVLCSTVCLYIHTTTVASVDMSTYGRIFVCFREREKGGVKPPSIMKYK
jgi:hypothetical protein